MLLRRKLLIANALLLVSLLAMAGLSLLGLRRQQEHLQASVREYAALQLVESATVKLIAAKPKLIDRSEVRNVVLPELRVGLEDLRHYKALLGMYDRLLPPEVAATDQARAKELTKSATARMAELVAVLEAPDFDPADAGARADALAGELTGLMKVCSAFLDKTRQASDRDLRLAIVPVAVLALVLPAASLAYGLWQYRRIMVPLQRLRAGSHRLSIGDFSTPCATDGPPEFAQLSRDFNQMADELHAFYRQLEEMVASKSRELVRSERLASVGFLAAGVAHEINTPLHVISGYAELCAKRLRRLAVSEQTSELLGWQDMIRDEAIRCRQITDKLLSLCRGAGGGVERDTVSLTHLASDVALMVRGLPNFQGRRLTVAIDPADRFNVSGNAAELKQVLLNLTVNALEAIVVGSGEVVVDARRAGGLIELTVTDNGRGMDATTLQHVFEPFFTSKRGSAGGAGTGLGLSITHAIITNHGGRITADSAGTGRGSRFIIQLPAAPADAETSKAQTAVAEAGAATDDAVGLEPAAQVHGSVA